MPASRSDVARELIELELRFEQEGPLTHQAFERWYGLATELFGAANPVGKKHPMRGQRHSFRLPTDLPCRARLLGEVRPGRLVTLSQSGTTITGGALRGIGSGDTLELVEVTVPEGAIQLDLTCRIVHVDPAAGDLIAGVEFSHENPVSSMERFFDQVYYPVYRRYLASVASGATA